MPKRRRPKIKKEAFAVAALILILTLAIINISVLNNLTLSISDVIQEAVRHSNNGDWDSAIKSAEAAKDMWYKSEHYTHIVLSHDSLHMAEEGFFNLLDKVSMNNPEAVEIAAQHIMAILAGIAQIEQLKLGSIF